MMSGSLELVLTLVPTIVPPLLLVLLCAVLLDLLLGDPRWLPHPVVILGRLISGLERRWNRGSLRKLKGVALALLAPSAAFAAAWLLIRAAALLHPLAGFAVEALLAWTALAARGLAQAAGEVLRPLERGDLPEARRKLSWIVGRDTDRLDEGEIARGAVETVAENTVDGITAPIFWLLIGGVPGALAYKAVNTLDSMVGHRNERFLAFGWASARLDDAANWIPARLTAFTMLVGAVLLRGVRALPAFALRTAVSLVLRDAPKHPSPNSGWPESAAAAVLGVRLGGLNLYKGVPSFRAYMGEPLRPLEARDIRLAVRVMHAGWIGFAAICAVVHVLMQRGFTGMIG